MSGQERLRVVDLYLSLHIVELVILSENQASNLYKSGKSASI